jgi:hypothetical protein
MMAGTSRFDLQTPKQKSNQSRKAGGGTRQLRGGEEQLYERKERS